MEAVKRPAKNIRAYLAGLGKKGAKARAAKLTPARRSAIARKAARARWGRRKPST